MVVTLGLYMGLVVAVEEEDLGEAEEGLELGLEVEVDQ